MSKFNQQPISKRIIIIAIIAVILITLCSVLIEQCTHGALTPNHNRYWHPFSFTDVNWITVLCCLGAYIVLALPWLSYGLISTLPVNLKWGIFPTNGSISKVVSIVLTLLGSSTGLLCTISYCYNAYLSITNTPTIMMDNEDRISIMLFILCMMFWGMVFLFYTLIYRDRLYSCSHYLYYISKCQH